ncbi:DNA transposition protein [Shumkonia mesophila]|uniref:DNA transposition protein n=1 Tax=Shumkonia mesophila TaxID=2838854 RepID=UPI00293490DA|nr:DNA transposition protein [Shumkonia mesophila]
MVKSRDDRQTMDLLDWQPPTLVKRYEEQTVRASTLRARVAHAVSATLRDSGRDRDEVAAEMGAWLGENVTRNMLDAYASEARREHTIPFLRLLALVHVTGDVRALQLAAEPFGHSVIEDRFLPWVEVGQLAIKKEEIARELDAAHRIARKGGKP